MHTVLIADADPILRNRIKGILKDSHEFEVVGEAADGATALLLCRIHHPKIALIENSLPTVNEEAATYDIVRVCPETRVMILSTQDDPVSVGNAVRWGAQAFLLKRTSDHELVAAMRTVVHGGWYGNHTLHERMLDRTLRSEPFRTMLPAEFDGLSSLEAAVLHLIGQGKDDAEIAALVDSDPASVIATRYAVMAKLGTTGEEELVALGRSVFARTD